MALRPTPRASIAQRLTAGDKLIALGDDRIGGYAIRWNRAGPDGTTFTRETALHAEPPRPVLLNREPIGEAKIVIPDGIGLWVESQLEKARKYREYIAKQIAAGNLKTAPILMDHLVRYGAAKSLDMAPIGAFDLRPIRDGRPLSPRQRALLAEVEALEQRLFGRVSQ